MRATRFSIHVCLRDGSILISKAHQIIDLLLRFNIELTNILKIDTFALFLVNSQVVFRWVDQIFDSLIIDFYHAHVHAEHDILRRVFYSREYSSDHPRNNALHLDVFNVGPLHRMSFT